MATHSVTVELPDEVIEAVGSVDAAAAKAREALVMALLRDATISQGQAARFLGVTRGDVLDLMGTYAVLSGPVTPEEVREEIEVIRRLAVRA